ncbi:MAG: septum site-determining protein MinD [Deltaproteobacteria bacterium]|nr:septum site-determining protein MinD [Deltaproteobacteria bacterium]
MNGSSEKGSKKLGEVYVVTSGKGGVGKTTVTASLGAALAMRGKRTLVVDADIGLRNLDVILGLENRVVFNLVDVAKRVCKPTQAIIKSKKSNNLYLLPASQTDEKDVVNEDDFRKVINHYKREFQFIIIDSPAGIEQGFKNACAGAEKALIVTNPEVSSIRDADRVVGLLASMNIDPRLIVNRIDFNMVRRGDMLSVSDVQEILGVPLIGVVERDEEVIVAANTGEPVSYNDKSMAGKAFSTIARRMAGEEIPIENFDSRGGFWDRLSRRFGVA